MIFSFELALQHSVCTVSTQNVYSLNCALYYYFVKPPTFQEQYVQSTHYFLSNSDIEASILRHLYFNYRRLDNTVIN